MHPQQTIASSQTSAKASKKSINPKDDFRNEPEEGYDCIESFRKWDFDPYMNGAYHYGFVLGLEHAIRHLRYADEEE